MSRKNRGKSTRRDGRGEAGAAASSDAPGLVERTWVTDTGTVELQRDPYVPGAWLLRVNGVPSSHIVPERPDQLEFEYMRWFSTVLEEHVSAHLDPTALRVLHLGGGACTMARYLGWRYPQARQVVVELDAALATLVREWLDLPRAPLLRIRPGEARAVTGSLTEGSRDVVIRDVFAGEQTPGHLRTVEFARCVDRVMAPDGLYLLNVGDTRNLKGTRAEVAALLEVFEHVAAVADPAMLKGRRYGNVVLAASHAPLPAAGSADAAALGRELLGGSLPAQYKDTAWCRELAADAHPWHDKPADPVPEGPEAGTPHAEAPGAQGNGSA
ncbi:spermidine synthase [Kocuria varians]|uniref:spermidine synthase n=1 Tax=Kocuria varians TaxID=1272 RepID=UPI001143304C|nr:fused MFS/spermidine synthase [Kocuria varians]